MPGRGMIKQSVSQHLLRTGGHWTPMDCHIKAAEDAGDDEDAADLADILENHIEAVPRIFRERARGYADNAAIEADAIIARVALEARSVSHDARPAPRQPVRRVGRASDGTRS